MAVEKAGRAPPVCYLGRRRVESPGFGDMAASAGLRFLIAKFRNRLPQRLSFQPVNRLIPKPAGKTKTRNAPAVRSVMFCM
jgi:hypothetical protein